MHALCHCGDIFLINIPVVNATIKVTALVSDYNLCMYVKVITEERLSQKPLFIMSSEYHMA